MDEGLIKGGKTCHYTVRAGGFWGQFLIEHMGFMVSFVQTSNIKLGHFFTLATNLNCLM